MIPVTRLNHEVLVVNCDLIKYIEQSHDSVITLVNNEKLTVIESAAEIVELVLRYRAAEAHAQAQFRKLAPVLHMNGEVGHG